MGGYNFGSGSGSGASDKLARDKFEYEKRQDAFQRAADLKQQIMACARGTCYFGGLQNYYGGGEGDFNKGFDNLLNMIMNQGKVSRQVVTEAYDRAHYWYW
jgi:hypothetical protein